MGRVLKNFSSNGLVKISSGVYACLGGGQKIVFFAKMGGDKILVRNALEIFHFFPVRL